MYSIPSKKLLYGIVKLRILIFPCLTNQRGGIEKMLDVPDDVF